jgi:hypothetical protein
MVFPGSTGGFAPFVGLLARFSFCLEICVVACRGQFVHALGEGGQRLVVGLPKIFPFLTASTHKPSAILHQVLTENQDVLPRQVFQYLFKTKALSRQLSLHLVDAHFVLGPYWDMRILLAVLE